MQIRCPACNQDKKFVVPLWVSTTFRIQESGELSLLHCTPKESIEEKLACNHDFQEIQCKECGEIAEIIFNEYEELTEQSSERLALEGL
jgi:hypothetical protein